MGRYLLLVACAMILNLAMTEDSCRQLLFTKYPKTQAIGKVVNTLVGSSEKACAKACFDASCTAYNMMVMANGKDCQLIEAIDRTITNDDSTLYGKKHIQFTVQKITNYIIRSFKPIIGF